MVADRPAAAVFTALCYGITIFSTTQYIYDRSIRELLMEILQQRDRTTIRSHHHSGTIYFRTIKSIAVDSFAFIK